MLIGGIQGISLIDYPGKVSAALFTIGCNMRCGYCHNPELVLPERFAQAIDLDEIFDFLHSRRGKLDGVVISGGEPTVQPDLEEFIAKIKSLGFLVKLDTQGTAPATIDSLIKKELIDFIAMDIKGPLHKYAQIAARPVDISAIQQSINIILSSGIDTNSELLLSVSNLVHRILMISDNLFMAEKDLRYRSLKLDIR